ncbi:hypothetical protein BGX24_000171 [Mortierella sp. AD032]|nr:hypothetical protein BGX24_000171 [Mortierella sp. AD032]
MYKGQPQQAQQSYGQTAPGLQVAPGYQQQHQSTAMRSAPLPEPQQQPQPPRHIQHQTQPEKADHYPPQKTEHYASQQAHQQQQQEYPPYKSHHDQQHQQQQQKQQPQAQQKQQDTTISPAREFTIVALGKSGEGKSTLLNSILGREIFLAKASVSEVTQHVDKATNHFLNIPSNPIMHCIDTPSFNGKLHDPHRINELGALLTKVAAGVDAFLFTVKCTRYRFDSTFYQTLLTYQSLLTPAFWSKLIIVFTHATPELLPPLQQDPDARLPLLAWSREIQEKFKLPTPPPVIFVMDFARFPYPQGGAQDFWERLMELDANTEAYCHKPFLESFGNGIAVEGYVQRIKGHLAVFEPRFFESQAEGQYQEHKQQQGLLKKRGTEYRFGLFRKSTHATTRGA